MSSTIVRAVLFIDFDGVLHPSDATAKDHFRCLPLLENVLRQHETLRLVISSSWRQEQPLQSLRMHFSPDIAARFEGVTPTLDPSPLIPAHLRDCDRHQECIEYIRQHAPGSSWLALDDQASRFAPATPHLFLVYGGTGLTQSDAEKLECVLQSLEHGSYQRG